MPQSQFMLMVKSYKKRSQACCIAVYSVQLFNPMIKEIIEVKKTIELDIMLHTFNPSIWEQI